MRIQSLSEQPSKPLKSKPQKLAYMKEYRRKNWIRIRERAKERYHKDMEDPVKRAKLRKSCHAYYSLHQREILEQEKLYREATRHDPETLAHLRQLARERAHEAWLRHKPVLNARTRRWRANLRYKVLLHYSPTLSCACCGEKTYEFLTLDHVNGGGNKHRKEIVNAHSGVDMYRWANNNDFPKDLQVLCYNCNCAKGRYGECPHEKMPKTEQGLLRWVSAN